MFKLHFYKGSGDVFDKAIRIWQSIPHKTDGSKYSHVEIEIDGITFSADANVGRVVSRVQKYHHPQIWDTLIIQKDVSRETMDFCRAQVGKGYDYIGIFTAQILALPFDAPDRWFCSELASQVCKMEGVELPHYNSWYNPRRLWDTLTNYEGVKRG